MPVLAGAPDMATLKRFVQLLNTEDYWSASLIEGRKKMGGTTDRSKGSCAGSSAPGYALDQM